MTLVTYDKGDFWVSVSGPYEIIENLPGNRRLIRFLFTGNVQEVSKSSIRKRTVVDVKSDDEPSYDNLHITAECVKIKKSNNQ